MSSSSVNTIHTIVPGANIPFGFFDEENIRFMQTKITDILKRRYVQSILVDRPSIIRLMERVLIERAESIPKMNQRVIMYAVNDYMAYQEQTMKHLNWQGAFQLSQRLYNPRGEVAMYDIYSIKQPNRLGVPKVGGTTRFYFT